MVATLMSLSSCKTKDVVVDKGLVKEFNVVEVESLQQYFQSFKTAEIESQLTQEELTRALSQLNINYNGDHIEDKLDVLLTQTADGTKVSFQGKGSAGYTETNNKEISTLRQDFAKYKDSITNEIKIENQRYFNQSEVEWNKRLKEVNSKTFTPIVWILLIIALIVGFLSNKLLKPFKEFLNRFKTSKEVEV